MPVHGGLLSIDLEVAKVSGKTRELSPLSEILALCCVLQAARISSHSSVAGSRFANDSSYTLEASIKNQDDAPVSLGLVRQQAVQAIRCQIKQRLVTVLQNDCALFFDSREGRTVLNISIITLHDQGGHEDALEVGRLAFRRAKTAYQDASWQCVLSGPLRQFLGLYVPMFATHPGSQRPVLSRLAYFRTFPAPERLGSFPVLDDSTTTSILRGTFEAPQLMQSIHRANFQWGAQTLPYLLYSDYSINSFRENWTVLLNSFRAVQSIFIDVTSHADFSTAVLRHHENGILTRVQALARQILGFLFPRIIACYRKHPGDVKDEVAGEMTEVISGVIRCTSLLWDLRLHYSPWSVYEFFSDLVANNLCYARGEIMDDWRGQYPDEVALIIPVLRFASSFSAQACMLCDELAEHWESGTIIASSSTTLMSLSDEIVQTTVSDLHSH